jgi:hypothetical protein
LVLLVAARRDSRLTGTAPVAMLCLLLFAGVTRMGWDAHTYANAGNGFHIRVTPENASAARWLRDHSDPADVVATNAHRVSPEPVPAWSLSFWMSGFTERRFLLESWGYTPTVASDSGKKRRYGPPSDFWDEKLLARNDAAITEPTPDRIAWLKGHGVRWIMVDRRFGAESARLNTYATLRIETHDLAIYQLKH